MWVIRIYFLRNAQALGIDLSRLQQVVLSHGHNDHTRGLLWPSEQEYFSELQIAMAHPEALKPKQFAGEAIGAPFANSNFGKSAGRGLVKNRYG